MSPNWFWQEIKMYATMLFLANLCNHHICLMYAIKTREFWSKERVEKTCFMSNSHTYCHITHVPKNYQLLQKQVNFLSRIIHQFCMLDKPCMYFTTPSVSLKMYCDLKNTLINMPWHFARCTLSGSDIFTFLWWGKWWDLSTLILW